MIESPKIVADSDATQAFLARSTAILFLQQDMGVTVPLPPIFDPRGTDRHVMAHDLSDFQAEAIARGYTHDFAVDGRSASAKIADDLRVVEYETFDSGTDPGDDVTIYLIESTSGLKGYLILSDSFHADPRKAAFIDTLLSKPRVNG